MYCTEDPKTSLLSVGLNVHSYQLTTYGQDVPKGSSRGRAWVLSMCADSMGQCSTKDTCQPRANHQYFFYSAVHKGCTTSAMWVSVPIKFTNIN